VLQNRRCVFSGIAHFLISAERVKAHFARPMSMGSSSCVADNSVGLWLKPKLCLGMAKAELLPEMRDGDQQKPARATL
jgi:hypothetical protein